MKKTGKTDLLVIGIYQDLTSAKEVYRRLTRQTGWRLAMIHKTLKGRAVLRNGLFFPLFLAFLLGSSLGVYLGLLVAPALAGIGGLVGGIIGGILGILRPARRVERHLLSWLSPLLLAGETALLVIVPSAEAGRLPSFFPTAGGPVTFFSFYPRFFAAESPGKTEREEEKTDLPEPAKYASRLGVELEVGPGRRPIPLPPRLRQLEILHHRLRRCLAGMARGGRNLIPGGEWFLDNAYLLQGQIMEVKRSLREEELRRAPYILNGPYRGLPRIYALADRCVAVTQARLTREAIIDFLRAYQGASPLSSAELWAFPLFLRLVLLERLAEAGIRVLRRQQEEEEAQFWADRLRAVARRTPEGLPAMVARLAAAVPTPSSFFALRLLGHLQDETSLALLVREWLAYKLDLEPAELFTAEQIRQTADQMEIANAVGSLRFLGRLTWEEVFPAVSRPEEILGQDPAGIYPAMDEETKNLYRAAIEELAVWGRKDELTVARAAIRLATAQKEDPRRGHVGYYLLPATGRTILEASLGIRPPLVWMIRRKIRRHAAFFYLGGIAIFTFLLATILTFFFSWLEMAPPLFFFALILWPAGEMAVWSINRLMMRLFPPRPLPRLAFTEGIPPSYRTLVVIPMMLSSPETIREEVEQLEVRYLANPDPGLSFALLADFVDADTPSTPADDSLLAVAVAGIRGLNERYGNRFYLFHRPRSFSRSEGCWIGRERKRGKLEELNRLLNGDESELTVDVGDPGLLREVRYVLTLDADTKLPPETARRLVGTMAHPLNRPEIDEKRGVVVEGHGLIQPRVCPALPSVTASLFARLFADNTGLDPYCHAVSDIYQDLTGEGTFYGKGIYDPRVFHRLLGGRFPAERILSHDLLEGAYLRTGFAGDVILLDLFPRTYGAYASRQHRWIRGDWQILDWLAPRVPRAGGQWEINPLSVINRWKIFDNLRRSLLPFGNLVFLLWSWFFTPRPLYAGILITLLYLWPQLPTMIHHLIRGPYTGPARREIGYALAKSFFGLVLLPHQAFLALDAVGRALYRRLISHRHLLAWETAQTAVKRYDSRRGRRRTLRAMGGISLWSAAVAGGLAWTAPAALPAAAFFLGLWLFSPFFVWLLDQPLGRPPQVRLTKHDKTFLRETARATWRYFDDFVGPADHWLPPDNFQEAPQRELARRTSPTNIGMWLLACLSAYDLGYLPGKEVLRRVMATMETLRRLEKYAGHFLNWYDTATLEPLRPRYVSTVDSGNLLAAFWTFIQGCRGLADDPPFTPQAFAGLADTLANLRASLPGRPSRPLEEKITSLARLLDEEDLSPLEKIRKLREVASAARDLKWTLLKEAGSAPEVSYWAKKLAAEAFAWLKTAKIYLPWFFSLPKLTLPPGPLSASERGWPQAGGGVFSRRGESKPVVAKLTPLAPSLRPKRGGNPQGGGELSGEFPEPELKEALAGFPSWEALAAEEPAWVKELRKIFPRQSPSARKVRLARVLSGYERARQAAREFLTRCERLTGFLEELTVQMDLGFLYDRERRLFTIGYDVTERKLDNSYYDLLASEARVAGFMAIARGEIPVKHWSALGRPFGMDHGEPALLSWNGTLFEYLMPALFQELFPESLLAYACRRAVEVQREYAHRRGIPWGISEAAFSALDAYRIYQYRAFGVPGLGLKRGLEEDLVVAPYATALALAVDPLAAVDNLRVLARYGLRGAYGFYESIDFTRERCPEGERGVVVTTYMAHHQGMTLVALDNALSEGIMRRRFHADPRVKAAESVLFERVPTEVPPGIPTGGEGPPPRIMPVIGPPAREGQLTANTKTPRVQLLSNGELFLMITNAGGGWLRWREFDLTRWRADTTEDAWGEFIYLRDLKEDAAWSAAYQPLGHGGRRYGVKFAPDRVEFRREDHGIETVMEVAVAPEDPVEIRRIGLVNHTGRRRRIEVTSYLELALAPHGADRSHPAFNKLFIVTEVLPEGGLLARRRRRHPEEQAVFAGHFVVTEGPAEIQYETDRARFLGRLGSPRQPAALRHRLTGTVGTVLDPIFSLRVTVTVPPGQKVNLAFLTVAGSSKEEVLALREKYRFPTVVENALQHAWTHTQLELRYLGLRAEDIRVFQELAGHLLYPGPWFRPLGERIKQDFLRPAGLWPYGISGDLPILLLLVEEPGELAVVREVLLAHAYLRKKGLAVDLVILNNERAGYAQPLQEELSRLLRLYSSLYADPARAGGVFLRVVNQMPPEDVALFLAVARVVLVASRGPLARQLAAPVVNPPLPARFKPTRRGGEEPSAPLPFLVLPYFNGLGGFTPDGREYAIYLGPGDTTPAPWVNILANPVFGTMVSEAGGGFTWSLNSQANRLTPWSNDPVTDPAGEIFYLRDEETGVFWTPTVLPVRELDPYRARHGQGYTVFEHNSHAIEQELTVFVPVNEKEAPSLRIARLKLTNRSSRRRRLAVFAYNEWVLGTDREETAPYIFTRWDAASRALMARNSYRPEFGERVAFAALGPAAVSFTADRTEFIGRNGSLAHPAAMTRKNLAGRTGAGLDPCAAQQVIVELDPGRTTEVVFLLGEAAGIEEARRLIRSYRDPGRVEEALAQTKAFWERLLGTIQVRTPLPAVDFLLNRWLLYQTLVCRLWARSAFYQSGGAYGFRDQLQDILALVHTRPALVREHLLRAAARQFTEGDVQHWWHPHTGAGTRTRCGDDFLWLVYATAHYVRTTGDGSILAERVPFLAGRPLAEGEDEAYFIPATAMEDGTLYEHCRRAVERVAFGPHGLPLIGSGDWNDGLNRVGREGRGESIWLAWFVAAVLAAMAEMAAIVGKREDAEKYTDLARCILQRVEQEAWDGAWYRRAYFDNGTPLGTAGGAAAVIDSIAQSWAAVAGGCPERVERALAAVEERLWWKEERLLPLFWPPFAEDYPGDPGYIKAYPPGVRENGGQYNHAALWLAMAFARRGDGRRAVEILQAVNPIERTRTPEEVERYKLEPYVVAADIYTHPTCRGRGGWSWYTGSAGWMYRVWLEEVLGFKRRGKTLRIQPVIPADWPGYGLVYRFGESIYEIEVTRGESAIVEFDGTVLDDGVIPLTDDGRYHRVRVVLGPPAGEPVPAGVLPPEKEEKGTG